MTESNPFCKVRASLPALEWANAEAGGDFALTLETEKLRSARLVFHYELFDSLSAVYPL